VAVLDADKLQLLTRKESQKDVPNYFIKNHYCPTKILSKG
jgi:hypothetical protein